MKFARIWFTVAGIWGLLVLTPLFFAFNWIGTMSPPPITHPEYYYGFVVTALSWQIAFLIIATDPVRHRTIMLAAMVEKFAYVVSCFVLFLQHRIAGNAAFWGIPDLILGTGFVVSYVRTTSVVERVVPATRARS